jgi:hypothetical protein
MHAIYRDYLKHEDTLVQHRVTWLLVMTGMLMTTYLTLYGLVLYLITSARTSEMSAAIIHYPITKLIFIPIVLTGIFGLVSAAVCFRSILGAAASSKSILSAWEEFKQSRHWGKDDAFLPELAFGFSQPISPTYGYPKTVCAVVAAIWVITMAADVFLIAFFGLALAGLV